MALGVIPVARAERSSALMRGELMRYLAELAWAPDAILFNVTLRWREDGPDRLSVSAGVGETAAEVTLSLDGEGRIAGSFAPDRPRSATAPTQHNSMARPFLRLSPARQYVASVCGRCRLGNRWQGDHLLAGPDRRVGAVQRSCLICAISARLAVALRQRRCTEALLRCFTAGHLLDEDPEEDVRRAI